METAGTAIRRTKVVHSFLLQRDNLAGETNGAHARGKLIHKNFCVNGAHLPDITVTSFFSCYRRVMRVLDRSHSCARPDPPKSVAGNAGGSEITPLCALVTIQM